MNRILKIYGREILDSRGNPTVEAEVYLEDGSRFGTLKDVMETGANDVYIVTRTDGSEVLLPAIHECILDVDLEENRMTVHLMKGLL